jgi:hypothetical protein
MLSNEGDSPSGHTRDSYAVRDRLSLGDRGGVGTRYDDTARERGAGRGKKGILRGKKGRLRGKKGILRANRQRRGK